MEFSTEDGYRLTQFSIKNKYKLALLCQVQSKQRLAVLLIVSVRLGWVRLG